MTNLTPDTLLERITNWAKQDDNIVAMIMTGSHARQDNLADLYSDFDIEFIVKDPSKLADNNEWLKNFGKIWISQFFNEGQPYPTRLIFYEGGLKVDFTLASQKRITDMIRGGLDDMFTRGYKVVFDKTNLTHDLATPTGESPIKNLPTQKEFDVVFEEFWFEAMHIPKYLNRDELWIVKLRDWIMKEQLLKMLEWYTIAHQGPKTDVWHIGSHMKLWLDTETWQELQTTFAHFDAEDSWKALLVEIKLFSRISKVVAEAAQLEYPEDVDVNVTQYIQNSNHS